MLNTFLCDELDASALRLVYAKWRGESVDPPQLKIALANCISYGIYLSPDAIFNKQGDPAPMFATASEEETDAAFKSILTVQGKANPETKKIGDGTFLKLIMPIALKILAGLLV